MWGNGVSQVHSKRQKQEGGLKASSRGVDLPETWVTCRISHRPTETIPCRLHFLAPTWAKLPFQPLKREGELAWQFSAHSQLPAPFQRTHVSMGCLQPCSGEESPLPCKRIAMSSFGP